MLLCPARANNGVTLSWPQPIFHAFEGEFDLGTFAGTRGAKPLHILEQCRRIRVFIRRKSKPVSVLGVY